MGGGGGAAGGRESRAVRSGEIARVCDRWLRSPFRVRRPDQQASPFTDRTPPPSAPSPRPSWGGVRERGSWCVFAVGGQARGTPPVGGRRPLGRKEFLRPVLVPSPRPGVSSPTHGQGTWPVGPPHSRSGRCWPWATDHGQRDFGRGPDSSLGGDELRAALSGRPRGQGPAARNERLGRAT